MNMITKTFLPILALGAFACNQGKQETTEVSTPVTDTVVQENVEKVEAIEYKTVNVNGLDWMVENLNVLTFRNGDTIPEAQTPVEWTDAGKAEKPAWCYYENKSENGTTHGILYNWYAVTDARGLAPEGFKIPSEAEMKDLIKFLGGEKTAGAKLKSSSGWDEPGNGNNESGLAILPSGTRTYNGAFNNLGTFGYLWSNTDQRDFNAWHLAVNHKSSIGKTYPSLKAAGFSVRCVKGN